MPDLSRLFPLILVTHITLAVALFVPSLLLPFTLRARPQRAGTGTGAAVARRPGRLVRWMLWMQARGTVVIGVGLALTGVALVLALGTRIVDQPWLLLSLALYAVAAVVALAIQRPSLRRLLRRDGIQDGTETEAGRAAWGAAARRQRYLAYAITTAVGMIGFLMSTKPALW
jgi:uncharacterized membrane protein